MSAADDLEKIMVDRIAITICRERLAREWRKVPDSNVVGTLAYYTISQIESGEMDDHPSMLAMMKLFLDRALEKAIGK